METFKITHKTEEILADIITPVSIFMKLRDIFPHTVMLESSDYHGNKNSYSFIGVHPIAGFICNNNQLSISLPGKEESVETINDKSIIPARLNDFLHQFDDSETASQVKISGIFGYSAYDAIPFFEKIDFHAEKQENERIPEIRYHLYKYVIAINHFQNSLTVIENIINNGESGMKSFTGLLSNRNVTVYPFKTKGEVQSNFTDEEFMSIVRKGKEHIFRGDIFQIVLSRQFSQSFTGDEFNVYRSLRSINPSPYLFYFDYGDYKLFGSSPEAQIEISKMKAYIYPIAGTFRRTGDDEQDKLLAEELSSDKKENAEHVMLVDLARNDLSRNATEVKVERYKEIQYYSHVLHMVSKVAGNLPKNYNPVKVMADSFPAGTLSGAPKYKAMQLIDSFENKRRNHYGGCIGYFGFNGDVNHAIVIRSFLSKGNKLYFQAGAGIVANSVEEKELHEVNNKLEALRKAIIAAQQLM